MNANQSSGGTVVRLQHESEVLRDNPLGDPRIRDLYVYVPAGYDEGDVRLPSVYCLTGFTGRGQPHDPDASTSTARANRSPR